MRGLGQVLPPQLMVERLMMQQQQMEEDQRWLEQEECFLVKLTVCFPVETVCDVFIHFGLRQVFLGLLDRTTFFIEAYRSLVAEVYAPSSVIGQQ